MSEYKSQITYEARIAEREAALTEKTIDSTEVYRGALLHAFSDRIELPNGHESVREYLRHPGAVCLVPLSEANEVLMVRQYRYPFHRTILEVPAGKLDPGEAPETAARRELSEETGAAAKELIDLGTFYPSVAYTDEIIYTYLARGLTFQSQHLDDDEFLDVERIPLRTLVDMVLSGELSDGKTQAAILKAAAWLEREGR